MRLGPPPQTASQIMPSLGKIGNFEGPNTFAGCRMRSSSTARSAWAIIMAVWKIERRVVTSDQPSVGSFRSKEDGVDLLEKRRKSRIQRIHFFIAVVGRDNSKKHSTVTAHGGWRGENEERFPPSWKLSNIYLLQGSWGPKVHSARKYMIPGMVSIAIANRITKVDTDPRLDFLIYTPLLGNLSRVVAIKCQYEQPEKKS